MSMDPSTIQALLMQKLQQPGSTATAGGGMGGPAMQSQTSPMNAAATIAQKAMLVNALQKQQQRQQQGAANGMMPTTNAQISNDPAMQALQQPPQMNAALLQQLQQPPAVSPTGGVPGQ